MVPDKRVVEVVSRLTGMPVESLTGHITMPLPALRPTDSLDTIELIMELKEEFDEDTIRWALRYIEAIVARPDDGRRFKPGTGPEAPDPLWDRDLDN